jgi:AraC-like DNA-binding protein
MWDSCNQIVEWPGHATGDGPPGGSTAAQWLDFPGCVFVRGEFRADHDAPAVVAPGLFVSVSVEDVAGRIPRRAAGCEGKLTAIAVRDDVATRGAVRCVQRRAVGLALPLASIDGLGLGDAFRSLFSDDDAGPAVVSLTASPRLQAVAADMFLPPVAGNGARLLLSAHAAEIVVHALFGGRGRIEVDPSADLQRKRLQSVKQRMDADLAYPWSVDEMARNAGLSRRSFNQKFQQAYGESPIDYLRARRLDAARALLIHQRLSVTEAAFRVGYSHPANFATAFRRRFGHSPRHCQAI